MAPFHLLPKPALEGACNAVMRTLVDGLLPVFVRQLAADYEKWATEPQASAEQDTAVRNCMQQYTALCCSTLKS